MQSEPKTPEIDPRDVGIAPETEPPGRIYKQVVREVLARIDQRLADIERHATTGATGGDAEGRTPRRGRLKRVAIGLLVVAGVAGAAFVWQRYDGDTAKAMVARYTPQFLTNVLSSQDEQDAAHGAGATTVGTAATSSDGRPAMADAPSASTPEPDGLQATAAATPDMASTIEKMSRDILTLGQGIEELKANQEQMSKDSAKATEQFKASEDQLIRMLLRVSEQQGPQPKTAVPTSPRTRTPQATAASPPRGSAARPRQGLPGLFSRRPT